MSDFEKALDERIERIVRKVLAERPANDVGGEYLSTTQAARLAAVTAGTIRRWIRQGELTRHEAGAHVRVRRDELEALLRCDVVPIDKNLSPRERARRRFG
jgi:excisionase family DNA binding protein